MADYHPLIARAVAGLEKNTGDARRALYERARTALVAQLRGVTPSLSESDVTRERLALEEAIRKVEAEAARQARVEPARADRKLKAPEVPRWEAPAPIQSEPPAPEPEPDSMPRRSSTPPPARPETALRRQQSAAPAPRQATAQPAARTTAGAQRQVEPVADQSPETPLPRQRPRPQPERRSLLDSGLKGFREVVSGANELGEAAARAARSARESFAAVPDPRGRDGARVRQPEDLDAALHEQPMLESSFALDDSRPVPPRGQPQPRPHLAGDPSEATHSYSYGFIAKMAVVAVTFVGLAGFLVWNWDYVTATYRFLRPAPSQVAQEAPPAATTPRKDPNRFEPGGQAQSQASTASAPATTAAVAQRVVLYEEDPADPAGKRFVGSAIWRTETVSPGTGQPPELAIRADIEIPERKLAVTWSLRRNTDQSLPASHTVEIMFRLPSDFEPGGITSVPGILMKQTEQTRGVPLAGLAVKVTNGFFLVGLSSIDADRERNIQLLKERSWFDIPVVYNNNRRAILALEKGTPGERVFADAFRVWGQ
jgi:hypothetical protein